MMSRKESPALHIRKAFDPETFRTTGHQLVDQLANYLTQATSDPSFPVLPWEDPTAKAKKWTLPFSEEPLTDFTSLIEKVLTEAHHLHNPRYVGHQVCPPIPFAALSDMVASLLNNSNPVYEMGPISTATEQSVICWMIHCLKLPESADGVFTSGGSLGNLTSLLIARKSKAQNKEVSKLAVLVSDQSHYSIKRALQIMGFQDENIRPVPVNAEFRMEPTKLKSVYEKALRDGYTPIVVVGNACSTATGSYDELDRIADFCSKHGLWFHVDATHGAPAILSHKYKHLLKGIERADSLVWDAHKMLLIPPLVTAVLLREGQNGYLAFAEEAYYLFQNSFDEWYNLGHRTFECTKRMIALPLYSVLATQGTQVFSEFIEYSYDLALQFAKVISESKDFELAIQPQSNIVCFRYKASDSFQTQIRKQIIESGKFYLVETKLPKGIFLRVTLINPLTTLEHLKLLLQEIRNVARKIAT